MVALLEVEEEQENEDEEVENNMDVEDELSIHIPSGSVDGGSQEDHGDGMAVAHAQK